MRLRHGPVPTGRRMFEIDAGEIVALAMPLGLRLAFDHRGGPVSAQNLAAGVTWTTLAFVKDA